MTNNLTGELYRIRRAEADKVHTTLRETIGNNYLREMQSSQADRNAAVSSPYVGTLPTAVDEVEHEFQSCLKAMREGGLLYTPANVLHHQGVYRAIGESMKQALINTNELQLLRDGVYQHKTRFGFSAEQGERVVAEMAATKARKEASYYGWDGNKGRYSDAAVAAALTGSKPLRK